MKKFTIVILFGLVSSLPALANTVRGVTICAATCQTESLGILNHDEAIVGKIYYAEATEENRTNTNYCLSNAKKMTVKSNRMTDDSLKACASAMLGMYFGKKVDLRSNFIPKGEEDSPRFKISVVE